MKTISSAAHQLVHHWVRLQNNRTYRHSSHTVLVEGKNLIADLLRKHDPMRLILTERHGDLFQEWKGDRIIISDRIAAKISSVESPEGCFAEYPFPVQEIPATIEKALVLDRLSDPGNVGTLFRTSLALDVRTIFCIEPCCDPWNPKTIRAAKGAQFDLSIISATWDTIPSHAPLLVADTEGKDLRTFHPPRRWFLVLGNEAHGPVVPQALHPTYISIPMPGPVESLNVSQAGAILLYTLSTPPAEKGPGLVSLYP